MSEIEHSLIQGHTVLHLAVVEKQSGCLNDLLKDGADVNLLDYELSWWKSVFAHSYDVLTAAQ